jgi:N-acetylglutamate synthase-like GNAT family acetyltransferase
LQGNNVPGAEMSIIIRPAAEADQSTITSLIHEARLNPRNLHWSHFLVAEEDGKIVGLRQVKIHRNGTREVASGLVIPEYQHQGISARLMHEILARENSPLYLMCNEKWVQYYEQFGFKRVALRELPTDFAREYRIGKTITGIISLFVSEKLNIVPMKRDKS